MEPFTKRNLVSDPLYAESSGNGLWVEITVPDIKLEFAAKFGHRLQILMFYVGRVSVALE